jgi:addiction module RelB/DinJ family antitoxin
MFRKGVTDMAKEQANYRLDAEAKRKAYAVFKQMGLKPTDAVNLFIHHVAMYGELPFKPSVPNADTIEALKEGEHPERMTTHTLEEFKRSLAPQ